VGFDPLGLTASECAPKAPEGNLARRENRGQRPLAGDEALPVDGQQPRGVRAPSQTGLHRHPDCPFRGFVRQFLAVAAQRCCDALLVADVEKPRRSRVIEDAGFERSVDEGVFAGLLAGGRCEAHARREGPERNNSRRFSDCLRND